MVFFTGPKLIVLNFLPKGSKFNQPYLVNSIFPDSKRKSVSLHRRIPQATFWIDMDNSTRHKGSKAASNSEKHHVSRLPHPPYSPNISPCEFWLVGMLNGVLKDCGFNSSNEIEDAITKVRGRLIFDERRSVFHNWMNCFAWLLRMRESILLNKCEMAASHVVNLKIGGEGLGTFFIAYIMSTFGVACGLPLPKCPGLSESDNCGRKRCTHGLMES
jgi:hypothetical protein